MISKITVQIYFPTYSRWGFLFLHHLFHHLLSVLLLLLILAILTCEQWNINFFIWIFLISKSDQYFWGISCPLLYFLFWTQFKTLAHFFLFRLLVYFILIHYIICIVIHCQISSYVKFFFTQLIVSLDIQKLLNFLMSSLSIVVLNSWLNEVLFRKSFLILAHYTVLLVFCYSSFNVADFNLRFFYPLISNSCTSILQCCL